MNLDSLQFLIVDDLRDMRMNLRGILESMQAKRIVEARSGDDALEQLQRHKADVVLCDYNMGDGRNGQQTLEEARGRGLLKPTAAWLMVTAEQVPEVVMGVVENSPDGYLVKPINKQLLLQRLERVIPRKRVLGPVEAACAAGGFGGAVAACDGLIEKYPPLRPDLLRLKARALLELGQFVEVADLCFGILTEREYPWALLALARARYELGSARDARRFLGQLIDKHPSVMEAYDLLARIEREAGNHPEARRVLNDALAISPLSVRRQQTLGDVAAESGEFAEAARAYERALRLGEDSCFARPEDAACLVQATLNGKGAEAAQRVMQDMAKHNSRRRGGHAPDWRLLTVQARLLRQLGQTTEAEAALLQALTLYRRDSEHDNAAHSLDLVRCCYELGRREEARGVVRKLVRENFDRAAQLELIEKMLDEFGDGTDGRRIIEEERAAVIKINNDGVLMAKSGRYSEGLAMLQQAAEELPNNLTVVANVVFATLIQMQKEGVSQQVRYIAHEYIARAERLAPRSPKVAQLRARLNALEAPQTAPAKA